MAMTGNMDKFLVDYVAWCGVVLFCLALPLDIFICLPVYLPAPLYVSLFGWICLLLSSLVRNHCSCSWHWRCYYEITTHQTCSGETKTFNTSIIYCFCFIIYLRLANEESEVPNVGCSHWASWHLSAFVFGTADPFGATECLLQGQATGFRPEGWALFMVSHRLSRWKRLKRYDTLKRCLLPILSWPWRPGDPYIFLPRKLFRMMMLWFSNPSRYLCL